MGIAAVMLSTPLVATSIGPFFGYKGTDATSYSFIDVAASGGASVLTSTDDGVAALALPFGFSFFGTTYSNICVSSNGAAYFSTVAGACAAVADFENTDLSSTPPPGDLPSVFPLWTDLVLAGPGAGVFYQTQGTEQGSRKFIVQWNNAYPLSKDTGVSPNAVTFEMILSEGSNQILFQYKTVDLGAANLASKGAQATIGIRDAGSVDHPPQFPAGSGKQIAWSHKSPVINDGSAILFTAGKGKPVVTATGGTFIYNELPHGGSGNAYGISAEPLTPVDLTYLGTGETAYPSSAAAPIDAGTYKVIATFNETTDYKGASESSPLTIEKAVQAIVFTSSAPGAAVVGGAYYTVTANGGASPNLVTFSTVTPSVCTVAGSTVSFASVGLCTIQADQAGDGNHEPAAPVQQSFPVGRGPQTAVFVTGPISVQYGAQGTAAAIGGDGTGVYGFSAGLSIGCSVAGTTVSVLNASAGCVLTATRAGDANYEDSAPSQPFTVSLIRAEQSITIDSVPPPFPVVNGPTYDLAATGGGSGTAVTFSSLTPVRCTVSGVTVSFVAVGMCQVAANQLGNGNYDAAQQTSQSFTVGQGTQSTVSVTGPASVTFATTGTATATGGLGTGSYSFSHGASSGCTVAGITVSVTDASGACALTATRNADANYLVSAPSAPFTVTLNKAPQLITFTTTPASPVVGGTYAVAASAGSGQTVTFSSGTPSVCTVAGSTVSFVGAGTCTLNADQGGNNNYLQAAQAQQTFTVASGGGYTFTGFFSPIDMSTPGQTVWNSARAGQAIPVKWRLTSAGADVSSSSAIIGILSYPVACTSGTGTVDDAVEEYAPGGSPLSYKGGGNWQINWATPGAYAATCRALVVRFNDQTTSAPAYFKFR